MVQRSNYAALKDAQVLLDKEEYAQIKLRKEECALSIGQHESK